MNQIYCSSGDPLRYKTFHLFVVRVPEKEPSRVQTSHNKCSEWMQSDIKRAVQIKGTFLVALGSIILQIFQNSTAIHRNSAEWYWWWFFLWPCRRKKAVLIDHILLFVSLRHINDELWLFLIWNNEKWPASLKDKDCSYESAIWLCVKRLYLNTSWKVHRLYGPANLQLNCV